MPSTLHTSELIQELKQIKQEKGLSFQNIYDLLEAANYHVSLNTIKKVFAEGSEKEHFRFHDTLQPISRVLLGIYGEKQGDAEIDALHAAIRVKDELIEKLERQIVEMKSESTRKHDFLISQISLKDERIDKLMGRVDLLLQELQRLLDRCDNCSNRIDAP